MVIGSTSVLLDSASIDTSASPPSAAVTFTLNSATGAIAGDLIHVAQTGTRVNVDIYESSSGQGTDTLLSSALVTAFSESSASSTSPVIASVSFAAESASVCTGADNSCAPAGFPALQLTSSANPATSGSDVTFTAAEPTLAGGAGPTGTVSFTADNVALPGCTGVMLNAGQAACTTTSLSAGSHAISAQYSGDSTYAAASASLTQTINADSDLAIAPAPDISVPATSSAGTVVTFALPAATDEGSETPAVTCDPASGATFPVGTTLVTCTATHSDDTPSSVQTTFQVIVTDADLVLSQPASITTDATGPSGAAVSYPPPVVSDEDGAAITPACSPASGSMFAIGTTTVKCTAIDPEDSNSPVSTSFTITVNGAAVQLAGLYQAVQGVGPGTSLADKVHQAESQLASGDVTGTCDTLAAFVREVRAQSGKSISPSPSRSAYRRCPAHPDRTELLTPPASPPRWRHWPPGRLPASRHHATDLIAAAGISFTA